MSGQGKALLKCCQCCRNAHQQGSLSVNENLLCWRSAHMREIGFRTESGKFLLVEFGILGFRMRNTSQTLKNSESTNDWNPESKCYWQRLESSSWNPEFVTWNPESKFVLDSLRARFRTLVYFFFSPFPTPLCLGSKNPPRVLFPYARLTISKEKISFCEQATETQVTLSLLVVVLVSFCVSSFLMILVYLAPRISGLVSL